MTFPLNVYLLAVVSAFATTLVALPFWRRWCLRIGLVDDPGHRKIHDEPVALAGGLAVTTGLLLPLIVASLFLWWQGVGSADSGGGSQGSAAVLSSHTIYLLGYGLHRRAVELAGLLLGAVGMLVLGLLDDKHELPPGAKFTGQFAISLLVAVTGTRITLFVHSTLFHYAITILWILTVINAFNFMDNMNGLCAGLGLIGAWYFGSVAAANGQYLVALIALLTCGALAGFLPYNFPRARAFLGDAGSHMVGYLLAVLAILPHFYTARHPRPLAVMIPLLVLAVPLLDLVWVVALRWQAGRPFYVGDTNHLSHRLVRRGLTRTQAVIIIWFIAAFIGGLVYWC